MDLQEFFYKNRKIALAFSGGVDSAYLLYAAKQYNAEVCAYYVNSQFQPQFELDDALGLAKDIGVEIKVIDCDVLVDKEITSNPPNRCYFCKQRIFNTIIAQAKKDGFDTIVDGTNASDHAADRPGMKALEEMKVLSPLKECGLDKATIRKLSKEAGLFTWNKPAYACLATRISEGTAITAANLSKIEHGEDRLREMGFSDFRVRIFSNAARIQIKGDQMELAVSLRKEIKAALSEDFSIVLLDLMER